jgi:hypothetical protein
VGELSSLKQLIFLLEGDEVVSSFASCTFIVVGCDELKISLLGLGSIAERFIGFGVNCWLNGTDRGSITSSEISLLKDC